MIDCVFPLACDDDTLQNSQTLKEWSELLTQASVNLGRSLTESLYHRDRLIDTGFTNVTMKQFKWPSNRWPKDPHHKLVGMWTLANIGDGLEGLSLALLTRGLGWTKEEVLVYLTSVRQELKDPKIHAYWKM